MNLFDWDEINFAECAREMIVSKDYLTVKIDFKPFWEKPPLFIWMQVLSMKAYGVNEFAARFPNALCGIATLMILYAIGKKLKNRNFGLWWAFIYAGSILPQFYFRSGIIDPWFNLFIFLSAWFFILFTSDPKAREKGRSFALLSGFFAGLAVLTKGPTAILILGLVISIFFIPVIIKILGKRQDDHTNDIPWINLLLLALAALIAGGFWFILQVLNGHADMVMKFIIYQVRLFTIPDAGHGGHWSYHFWILLIGVFPASVLAIRSFRLEKSGLSLNRNFHRLMLILFWVVLILFSIVKTKIVHYSSLCYFPLTFLATLTVTSMIEGRKSRSKGVNALLILLSSVISLVIIILPVAIQFKQHFIDSGVIKDAFAVANLRADVHWTGLESLVGVLLLSGTIAGIVMMKRNILKGMVVLFSSSLLFTWLAMLVFPYKIEQYSQRAAIEFFREKADEHCYLLNAGYFSYAPLFYGNKMPDDVRRPMWLLTADIDRPFYLVLKEPEYNEWKHIIPAMEVLYKKNGFVFLKRRV
jgi:4-amino-4-deoxy-L-arabinose transferase-like glycosyltransferase